MSINYTEETSKLQRHFGNVNVIDNLNLIILFNENIEIV